MHSMRRGQVRKQQSNAAALPTAYLTGYQALRDHARMQPGQRVLVIGASGGCGLAGCQLAKALGASEVYGVCSAKNAEVVRRQGAVAVAYDDASAYAALSSTHKQGFDVVYDCATGSGAGEDYSRDGGGLLRPGGRLVAINGGALGWARLLLRCQSADRKMMLTRQSGPELTQLLELLGGQPPVVVDSTHALSAEGVAAGFDRLKSRRAVGKVLFEVNARSA